MVDNQDRHFITVLATVSNIGMLNAISILLGLGFGYWLDRIFKTEPWLAFIFTLFGLVAGIYESAKILIKSIPDDEGSR